MISSMIIHKTIAKNTGIGINACGMVNQNEAEQRDILINEKKYTEPFVETKTAVEGDMET